MDPELIPILAPIDAQILQAAAILKFPSDELKRIHSMRSEIDDRIRTVREEIIRKSKELKEEVERRTKEINTRISTTITNIPAN